jgi:DnaK suppressor protein
MVAKRKSTTHAKQETSKNPGKTIVSDSHKSTTKTAPKKNGAKATPVKPTATKMKKTKSTTTKTTMAKKTSKTPPKSTKSAKTADNPVKAAKDAVAKASKKAKITTSSNIPKRKPRRKSDPELVTFKPYVLRKHEKYMNENQKKHFITMLLDWRKQLMEEVDRTVSHMKDEAANYPDPSDRASQEEEFSIELRTRDRERKLIRKIEKTIDILEQDDYGYCESCGIEIGIRRLEARPTATQCIDCKTLDELKERQIHG